MGDGEAAMDAHGIGGEAGAAHGIVQRGRAQVYHRCGATGLDDRILPARVPQAGPERAGLFRRWQRVGVGLGTVGGVGTIGLLQRRHIQRHGRGLPAPGIVPARAHRPGDPAVVVGHHRKDTLVQPSRAEGTEGPRHPRHCGRAVAALMRVCQPQAMAEFVDQGCEAVAALCQPGRIPAIGGGIEPAGLAASARGHVEPAQGRYAGLVVRHQHETGRRGILGSGEGHVGHVGEQLQRQHGSLDLVGEPSAGGLARKSLSGWGEEHPHWAVQHARGTFYPQAGHRPGRQRFRRCQAIAARQTVPVAARLREKRAGGGRRVGDAGIAPASPIVVGGHNDAIGTVQAQQRVRQRRCAGAGEGDHIRAPGLKPYGKPVPVADW